MPFTVTVTAYNIQNDVIPVYDGTATLGVTGTSGTLPINPTTVTFASGSWTGQVSLAGVDPMRR